MKPVPSPMQNILIYIEPRTDLDTPVGRGAWLGFALELLRSMGISPNEPLDHIKIVTNRWVSEQSHHFGVDENICTVIDEQTLLAPFGGNSGLRRHASFLETPADKASNIQVGDIIKAALEGFEPDLIITFIAEPALRYAFPCTPVLHHEIGGFSRPPYPQTFRLDPCGLIADSWPYQARDALKALPESAASQQFMAKLRNYFLKELIAPFNPFGTQLDHIKSRFSKVWLLPLGPPLFNYHYPVPDSPVNFMTQFDMIQWIMPQVPKDQGVLLVEHPQMPFLTEDQIDCIRSRYANACFLPETAEVQSCSQYIVPYVDGVITMNSSVGYQAALYGKELVCLGGRSFLAPLSDTQRLSDISDASYVPQQSTQKDAILHHLLTHYFIPAKMFRDAGFIKGFINQCMARCPATTGGLGFFDRIAADEVILHALMDASSPAPPAINYPLSRKMPASQLALLRKYDQSYLWPTIKGEKND